MAKSDQTYARYNVEYVLTLTQFINESDRDDLVDLSTEGLALAVSEWVLNQHDRWAKAYLTQKCLSMAQRVEQFIAYGMIDERTGAKMLEALQEERPRPAGIAGTPHPKKRQQQKRSGPVRNKGLRKVIRAFSNKDDEFSIWIAGFLRIGSRIGWRPGELLNMSLNGRTLSAPAEKYGRKARENAGCPEQKYGSGERGLSERLEVRISERYPHHALDALRAWVGGAAHWRAVYEGDAALLAAIRERIYRACLEKRVKPFSPYGLRHFAIASMKRSGRSREEIAAIVNHLSNRSAGESYAKARSGVRRPRAMISVDPARIAQVRKSARPYPQWRFDQKAQT